MSWSNRIILAVFLAAAIAYFPTRERESRGDVSRAVRERAELSAQNDELEREIRGLEAEVEALRGAGDDGAPVGVAGLKREELARIARQDLNMIRTDEYVFEIVDDPRARPRSTGSTGSNRHTAVGRPLEHGGQR